MIKSSRQPRQTLEGSDTATSELAAGTQPSTSAGPDANKNIRGRGANANPANRFEKIAYEPDPESQEETHTGPATELLRDTSKTFITYNDSPDVGFNASINPYRGCEHGCIYCYARPTHEYLGFSAGLDFETRILVKEAAPDLLRKELSSPKWKPQVIAISGVTDPYQPVERRLGLTRACLKVLLEFLNPLAVVTKNYLVTRDIDLLAQLAEHHAAAVFVSVTTLDGSLTQRLEPRASQPERRLEAIHTLAKAGIPVGVMVAPVIPGLTDHEMPSILKAASEAGARRAGYVMLRLPYGVSPLFEDWLDRNFADRKDKILHRIRSLRSGQLNDPRFRSRMSGEGTFADQVKDLFAVSCRKANLNVLSLDLSTESFRTARGSQLSLFN
jgi:DNA repair photolyase